MEYNADICCLRLKKRLEGPKYNIDFGGKGLGYRGEEDRYVHYAKRGHLWEVRLNTFVPHCRFTCMYTYTTEVEQWVLVCLELV